MISQRYGKVVALLLMLGMGPAIVHSYLGITAEDGYRAKLISSNLANLHFTDTERYDIWAKETFDADDWIERRSVTQNGSEIRLFIARSFDYKRLYHHPELAILYGKDLENSGIQTVNTLADVPVRFLRNRNGTGIAAYCLLFDGEFIENPIFFQFFTSFTSLMSARKPITLFFVYDNQLSSPEDFGESLAGGVLKAAIDDFLSQQSP